MTPQKWGFWCQIKLLSPKKVIGGPKKWKKLFFSKTAHPTIYLKSNMSSVNLMRTSCSGICLGHWLLIFWFTRRAVARGCTLWHFKLFFFVVLPLPLHCGQRPDGQKKLIFRKAPLNRCLHISSLGKIPYDLFLILMSFLMDLINHWQHYCNWKLAFLELDWKKFSLVIC